MASAGSQANWHWAEGIKFALEGVKLLFLLNGAASISVLTFIGHIESGIGQLIISLIAFALGAALTIPAMIFAYLTQLNYGNATYGSPQSHTIWETAAKLHNCAYVFVGLAFLCFLAGTVLAAFGLWHLPSSSVCPTP
jgi:hypothetical protein